MLIENDNYYYSRGMCSYKGTWVQIYELPDLKRLAKNNRKSTTLHYVLWVSNSE